MKPLMILAPLRGVTIRCFRETYADLLASNGFAEALTPFVPAMAGLDPLKDRELRGDALGFGLRVTPQFIGKDPAAFRAALLRVRSAGYDTADLNCGCPFPMVRNKGRGSGILRTPDVLRAMLDVGCSVMGPGKFSIKARLGVEHSDELMSLMPLVNAYPLRFLTVHARTARQMYEGACDVAAFARIADVAKVPLVYNGDLPFPPDETGIPSGVTCPLMVGRGFIRYLGTLPDCLTRLQRYIAASQAELYGERPVLGRLKELIAYWKDLPRWRRLWPVLKLTRTVEEMQLVLLSLRR